MNSLRLAVVATFAAVASLAAGTGDTDISISCGTRAFSALGLSSGSSGNVRRYHPATPGCVIVNGPGEIEDLSYITLDGFEFRQNGSTLPTIMVHGDSTHITIKNSEIVGAQDIHTGFNQSGAVSCQEFAGHPTAEAGGLVLFGSGVSDVLIDNVTIHGYHTAFVLEGANVVMQNSLIRNNFNIADIEDGTITIKDSVFWTQPNHSFEMHQFDVGSTFTYTNNLLVDSQDIIYADADNMMVYTANHNTFWIPDNDPCLGAEGWMLGASAGTFDTSATMTNNIYVGNGDAILSVDTANVSKITSNYNLLHDYSLVRWWVSGSYLNTATWKSNSGEDANSVIGSPPVFVDPPEFEDFEANEWGFKIPTSVAEARAWMALAPGSPGKAAASDGQDMGITSAADTRRIFRIRREAPMFLRPGVN